LTRKRPNCSKPTHGRATSASYKTWLREQWSWAKKMFFAWTKHGSNGRRHNPMVRQWHSRTRCNIRKEKWLRPLSQRVEALSPDQVVRQPDWGFQDRPLTRKSSDWESTNINSKAGRP